MASRLQHSERQKKKAPKAFNAAADLDASARFRLLHQDGKVAGLRPHEARQARQALRSP